MTTTRRTRKYFYRSAATDVVPTLAASENPSLRLYKANNFLLASSNNDERFQLDLSRASWHINGVCVERKDVESALQDLFRSKDKSLAPPKSTKADEEGGVDSAQVGLSEVAPNQYKILTRSWDQELASFGGKILESFGVYHLKHLLISFIPSSAVNIKVDKVTGKVFVENVAFQIRALCPNGSYQPIEIPGTITSIYELTPNGIALVSVNASNKLLAEFVFPSDSKLTEEILKEKGEEAEKEELMLFRQAYKETHDVVRQNMMHELLIAIEEVLHSKTLVRDMQSALDRLSSSPLTSKKFPGNPISNDFIRLILSNVLTLVRQLQEEPDSQVTMIALEDALQVLKMAEAPLELVNHIELFIPNNKKGAFVEYLEPVQDKILKNLKERAKEEKGDNDYNRGFNQLYPPDKSAIFVKPLLVALDDILQSTGSRNIYQALEQWYNCAVALAIHFLFDESNVATNGIRQEVYDFLNMQDEFHGTKRLDDRIAKVGINKVKGELIKGFLVEIIGDKHLQKLSQYDTDHKLEETELDKLDPGEELTNPVTTAYMFRLIQEKVFKATGQSRARGFADPQDADIKAPLAELFQSTKDFIDSPPANLVAPICKWLNQYNHYNNATFYQVAQTLQETIKSLQYPQKKAAQAVLKEALALKRDKKSDVPVSLLVRTLTNTNKIVTNKSSKADTDQHSEDIKTLAKYPRAQRYQGALMVGIGVTLLASCIAVSVLTFGAGLIPIVAGLAYASIAIYGGAGVASATVGGVGIFKRAHAGASHKYKEYQAMKKIKPSQGS